MSFEFVAFGVGGLGKLGFVGFEALGLQISPGRLQRSAGPSWCFSLAPSAADYWACDS